jgi:hypothetical protein
MVGHIEFCGRQRFVWERRLSHQIGPARIDEKSPGPMAASLVLGLAWWTIYTPSISHTFRSQIYIGTIEQCLHPRRNLQGALSGAGRAINYARGRQTKMHNRGNSSQDNEKRCSTGGRAETEWAMLLALDIFPRAVLLVLCPGIIDYDSLPLAPVLRLSLEMCFPSCGNKAEAEQWRN